jgi:hypothetical protein
MFVQAQREQKAISSECDLDVEDMMTSENKIYLSYSKSQSLGNKAFL